jgi:CheY-like chemotaxis protein
LTYVDGQVTFALSPLIRGISLARKILLADDSVTAQNMGRKILADAGYEVIAVNNGSAALKKIAELKPDLVILDVYMPGYSGLEVCQRLKESPETERIPVLLTVGKLEPFKPEEAQRVRAEGFIVKPFEASELLSTLSKLEDKVVPRAEPSKPGRFARAIAAAEESGRGGRNEGAGDDNGWKSRIGFPKKKREPEGKVADEAPVSKPVNRDLRTAVERPLEKAAERVFKNNEDSRQQSAEAAGTSVDLAAVATSGLPKDVTPEEVAAIAAAAAHMQMVSAGIKDDHQVSATQINETRMAETKSQASLEPAPDRAEASLPSSKGQAGSATAAEMEAKTAGPTGSREDSKLDSAAGEAAADETYRRRKGDARSEETQDVPVTMAATAESVMAASAGASRWTAVSVALEGGEAAISLDQEMQTAHAAFAAADSAGAPEAARPTTGDFSAHAQAAVEAPATISNPGPEPASELGPVRNAAPAEAGPPPVRQPEVAAVASSYVAAEPIAAEVAPVEAMSPRVEFAEPIQKPAPGAEQVRPVAKVEFAEPAASGVRELQPRPEAEAAMAESATASSSAFASIASRAEDAAEPAAEPKLDPEAVKNTAAAWASWRETRDTSKGNEAEAQPKEFDRPESAPAETAAMAVAAGAEQALREVSAAARDGESKKDVASIVDSVLADLRPKLMEEISRKMSEKK